MVMPTLHAFNKLGEMLVHKYERYLPTAFDESLSLLEKVNKVIEYLNETGKVTNDLVEQWNAVMEWVMNDGLNSGVIDKLNTMVSDGTLDEVINTNILGSRARVVVGTSEPNHDNLTFWYETKGSPNPTQNFSIVVSEDEPQKTTQIWYDVE